MSEYDDGRLNDGGHDAIELEEPQRIEHLSELTVGDKIVFGDYSEPRTVTELGEREFTDNRIDETVTTPMVRVEGERSNAKMHVLTHKLNRWDGEPILEEMDAIVACEGGDFEHGREVAVVRTHIGGSRSRLGEEKAGFVGVA